MSVTFTADADCSEVVRDTLFVQGADRKVRQQIWLVLANPFTTCRTRVRRTINGRNHRRISTGHNEQPLLTNWAYPSAASSSASALPLKR